MRRSIFSIRRHLASAAGSGSRNAPKSLSQLRESFASGTSANYTETLYAAYKAGEPIHASWKAYFEGLDAGLGVEERFHVAPSLGSAPAATAGGDGGDAYKLSLLIRGFQVRGHRLAQLDPLGLQKLPTIPELELSTYGFTEADLERTISLGNHQHVSGFLAESGTVKLGQMMDRLRSAYCGTIGAEYMHLQDREECNWVRDRLETPEPYSFPAEERKAILDRLLWADSFERFLASKWSTAKRFGLDGGETLIPGLKAMIDRSADLGVENVVLGMPHRGRLSVLANVVRKPMEQIFAEFSGGGRAEDAQGSGDVKYHLGTTYERPTRSGKTINLSLMANPSHLEAVNPLVLGKVRAKQYHMGDTEQAKVMGVLLHGDAAFAGQGIVAETFNFWELKGYRTGGTIHVVVNNQIGFTTDPEDARSSPYCTAVAKAADAPIFHVNGDDVEAVTHVFELAAEFRQRWKKDVVIDLICYRRFGHNEMDEPKFTQPTMYNAIKKMKSSLELYKQKLLSEDVISQEEWQALSDNVQSELNAAYEKAPTYVPKPSDWLSSHWKGFKSPAERAKILQTGVPQERLRDLGLKLSKVPDGFNVHKALARQLKQRAAMFAPGSEEPINWATAELLAYATLLTEGNHVRLSGQDVQRGTFSHRHAVLHDQKTGESINLLDNLAPDQQKFSIYNSALSEYGVLGFEMGYALENPNQLVLQEQQFADFANGAQIIIDQFLASGETKWGRQCGLTLLLPHGFDGMGPEHSSGRIERFLELVDSDPYVMTEEHAAQAIQRGNLQILNCTTPANYFHALRRQVHREFRKPLVVFTPKKLLRHPRCVSPLHMFDDKDEETTTFYPVLGEVDEDIVQNASKVKRLIFCSGQVYYDLLEERERRGIKDVALVRMEQLAPFPFHKVQEQQELYANAEPVWAQEEHMNAGAYKWAYLHFRTALNGAHLPYVGRPPSAAPATGVASIHKAECDALLRDAFDKKFD